MLLPRSDNEKELAVGYIRVSGPIQVTEGNSLATQERNVKLYAQDRRYILLKMFVEPGHSAKTDNRPVLKELLTYCKARKGRIKVVIFPKVDRFARHTRDYQNLKHDLARLGIRLESVSERFDDTPFGRFSESVMAAQAQLDNEVRAERAKDGHIQALQEGRWPWPAPGFEKVKVNNKNTVKPKEPEASWMREAFERLANRRQTPKEARLWLWRKGIRLTRAAFYRTIQKKLYIGILESYGVTQVAAPPIVPLVSEELFHRAHAALRLKRTPRQYERNHPDFPLRGTLQCSCGKLLTACWSQGKSRRYAYYRCTACSNVNLPKSDIEEGFVGLLNRLKPSQERIEELRKRLMKRWQIVAAELHDQIFKVEQKIASIKKLQQAIVLKSAQGVIPDELAKDQLDELQQKIVEHEASRPATRPQDINGETITDFFFRFLSRPGSAWQLSPLEEKKRLQRFYCPSGLTYHSNGGFRTRPKDPLSGLLTVLQPTLSHEAGRANQSPNSQSRTKPSPTCQNVTQLEDLCLRIYEQFGEPMETALPEPGRNETSRKASRIHLLSNRTACRTRRQPLIVPPNQDMLGGRKKLNHGHRS
jgi:site-specific DNA recombinase